MNKRAQKRIARHLAKSIAANERGKLEFDKSSQHLSAALAAGLPLDEPITLANGTKYFVTDNFAGKDVVYRPARFPRFSLNPYKEPKIGRVAKTAGAPAEAAAQ